MIQLIFAALCGTGFTPAAAQRAASEGTAMVRNHAAYSVSPWLLYQSADPLRAQHGRADIDAVIVETPYERVRYEAYLDSLQGIPVTPAAVRKMRAEAASQVGFLAYAHSRSDLDRKFLAEFRPAYILLPNGTRQNDSAVVRFGPSDDFYDVGTFREERWVGSIDYRFALANCAERGRVRFTDAYGHPYEFAFDLQRYR